MSSKQKGVRVAFCPNCGEAIEATDAFCQHCGRNMTRKTVTETPLPRKTHIDSYKGYIQALGAIEIVLGLFALIGAIFVGFAAFFVPLIMSDDRNSVHAPEGVHGQAGESWHVEVFVGALLVVVAILLLCFAVAAIQSGRKLLQYKNSGRIGTMVIGVLLLLWFPFGTLFGLAALYVLTRPEVEQLYSGVQRSQYSAWSPSV
ncbi:MAG: zinc-ribbon domain-containing protein [Candidatus Hodarchaeota archaeon]